MTKFFSSPFRTLTGIVPSWRPGLISIISFVFFLALTPQLPVAAIVDAATNFESESRAVGRPSVAQPGEGSFLAAVLPKMLAATSTPVDLRISQSDDPEPVRAGTQLTFTITVTNATSTPAKNVMVVDTLDPNVDFNNSSECELTDPPTDPVTLTCDLGTIPGGQNKIFDVTVDVPPDVADGTTLTNNVVVSSDGIEQTPSDNEADETTQVVTEADLAVDISELDPPAIAGEPLTYRVTVDNLGPSDSQDVELVNTFTLPAGVSLAALPGGCSESVPDVVTCSLGTVDAGASQQVELTLALGPDAAKNDTISLISAASSLLPTPDPTPGNDEDNIDTTITTEADLVVTVSDDLDPVAAGTSFTYSVQVKNLGPSDSQDIEVVNTLALPAGAVIASVPSGCVQGPSNVLTCDVGVLGVNATADIAIDVNLDASLPAGESVSNNAVALSAQTADPTPGDNDVTESTLVKADSDLSIQIAESADPINVGSQLEYEVTVNNGGPSDAQNVEVTNALTLPTDVTVSSTSGCSNDPNGAATCSLGSVGAGQSKKFDLILDVGLTATHGSVVEIDATVTSDSTEISAGDETASESTSITAEADLQLTLLTSSPNPVMAGNRLVYQITVTNIGPAPAAATVVDTLPANTTFDPDNTTLGTCGVNGNQVTCVLPVLSTGVPFVGDIGVIVDVEAIGDGPLTNSVVVSIAGNGVDSNTGNNSASVLTDVIGVNSTDDNIIGVCDAAHCSLREALILANADPDVDYISFDISGNAPHTIKLLSPLVITGPVTIDGTTQNGHAVGSPVVELEPSGSVQYGIRINGSGITVKGLMIHGFYRAQILFESGIGNTISGNLLGTDGNAALGGGSYGVRIISTSSSTIGGFDLKDRNVISGNGNGVVIEGAGSFDNWIIGNVIGTNFSGDTAIRNSGSGVLIFDSAHDNRIEDNVLSGNGSYGIFISNSDNNSVVGNLIGTDSRGTSAISNRYGVYIANGSNNTVGGDSAQERNVISGNIDFGIYINGTGATDNRIIGNYIGLDASGTRDLGNRFIGVVLASAGVDNQIGSDLPAEGNVISANGTKGSSLSTGIIIWNTFETKVQGNLIGTDLTGTRNRGNLGSGIIIANRSSRNTIGGTVGDSPGNVIAFNFGDGVRIDISGQQSTNNAILSNSIFRNDELGIDLTQNNGSDGVTPNDPDDIDEGPNRLQNFPFLALAQSTLGGDLVVRYSVSSDPANSDYPLTIQFFEADVDVQEGMIFLGSDEYTVDDFNNGFKDAVLQVEDVEEIASIVATATDSSGTTDQGNTSEFSEGIGVDEAGAHKVNSVSDRSDQDTSDDVCDTGEVVGGLPECTLRAAIEQSNALVGVVDRIKFDIPVPTSDPLPPTYNPDTGVFTILPATPLPEISDPIVIDGTSQPGYAGLPLIELSGASAGEQTIGLLITGGNSTIKGLVINGFGSDGIQLRTGGYNLIQSNFIGTDPLGLTTDPDGDPATDDATSNGGDGIRISRSAENTIGGVGQGNLISGNLRNGLSIFGLESTGNKIQDNKIGTDLSGLGDLGNAGDGVSILDASNNAIGGTDVGSGNVIAFNKFRGVSVESGTGNSIQGNRITANKGLGIDLGGDGRTDNDAERNGEGANKLQKFPSIRGLKVTKELDVEAEFVVESDTAEVDVEFFKADSQGQGRILIGGARVDRDIKNIFDLGSALSLNVVAGDKIVAVATDMAGNSSEFSDVFTVTSIGPGGIFVVNTTGDDPDESEGDGLCDTDLSTPERECSLRAAIQESNKLGTPARPGLNRIEFAIESGPQTLSPLSELPPITDALIIDGTSQPGFRSLPIIQLNGSEAGLFASGLTITGGNSLVLGLVINDFGGDGIVLEGNGDSIVSGNLIGTDALGESSQPNLGAGVSIIDSKDNLIGGTTDESRNVISGNFAQGIVISGPGSSGNRVQGNFVGIDITGRKFLIGGGNGNSGIRIVDASDNLIGGIEDGTGNVIAGNGEHGVFIIGENERPSSNKVQGNFIGTDRDASLELGNGGAGVRLEGADDNLVGSETDVTPGACVGACNTIAFNGDRGISLDSGTGNAFLSNSIFNNGDLGIDLFPPDGLTENDIGDADDGANNLQNFPVLESARIDANKELFVKYTVDSTSGSSAFPLRVQFFKADSENQEGALYIGSVEYLGPLTDTVNLGGATGLDLLDGDFILATATDADGNTSEFSSQALRVVDATFLVNLTTDAPDGDLTDGVCDTDISTAQIECSLRAAIQQANEIDGVEKIEFDLQSGLTIFIDSAAIEISDPVFIDGFSQDASNGTPIVTLDGSAASGDAFHVTAGNTKISGLVITGFPGDAIVLSDKGGNEILGNEIDQNEGDGIWIDDVPNNLIGTQGAGNVISSNGNLANKGVGVRITGENATGNIVLGNEISINDLSGVSIEGAPGNDIGGPNEGDGNVVIGNKEYGVFISGEGASDNRIRGNLIGTDGTTATNKGNGLSGIMIEDAPNTIVGGDVNSFSSGEPCTGECNVISGNSVNGIEIKGALARDVIVKGNYIGTDADGDVALPNKENGILISGSSDNTIGGPGRAEANLISGNDLNGIMLNGTGSRRNVLMGNLIGVDVGGDARLPNQKDGIALVDAQDNTIGGPGAGEGNVISGNRENSVSISGSGATLNALFGNRIGTDSDGNGDLGNDQAGVSISDGAHHNTIGLAGALVAGGICENECNVIANNDGDGVAIIDTAGIGNAVLSNSMFANGQTGIDLGPDGPTENDGGDGDAGPNNLQNFPVISSAVINAFGNLILRYVVDSPSVLHVELFKADADGQEGRTFLGDDTYTSGVRALNLGNAASLGVEEGDKIVATATDADGNTSEFFVVDTILDRTGREIDPALTLVVNDTGDGGDNDLSNPVCDNGSGKCTLRAAIEQANSTDGADTIKFAIAGGGEHLIQPGSELLITDPVVIEGSSQGDFVPGSSIALDNVSLSGDEAGLRITSGDSKVDGLTIRGFPGAGILLETNGVSDLVEGNENGGSTVTSNYIVGNSDGIRIVNSENNIVGGDQTDTGNRIVENTGNGVSISAGSTNNLVIGNLIGTDNADPNLAVDLGNSQAGVRIDGASDNTVRLNTIAHNGGDGVFVVSGVNNAVLSNSMFANIGMGIDLGPDGVNTDDPGDGDSGPNNLQNRPVLSEARIDRNDELVVRYGVDTTSANSGLPLLIEFFLADVDGEEGLTLIGSHSPGAVPTDQPVSLGNVAVSAGDFIVATATDTSGIENTPSNTSEFSASVIVEEAEEIIVTSNLDGAVDGCDDNCTLREAIIEANQFIGFDEIIFALDPSATAITLGSELPEITETVHIDGTTQANFVDTPVVKILGNNVPGDKNGLSITANEVTVQGLSISGFGGNGIFINSSDNTIGGTNDEGNTIFNNARDGIRVADGQRNSLRGNSIFGNTGLGINLLKSFDPDDGATENDLTEGDEDADGPTDGPNSLQNFPELQSARIDALGDLVVDYMVPSDPQNTTFPIHVDFFIDDPSGQREDLFLGTAVYTDEALGFGVAVLSDVVIADGDRIVATATDQNGEGSTSEMSGSVSVFQDPPIVVDSIGDQTDDELDGICATSQGDCTLRAAMEEANNIPGAQKIEFDIIGPTPHVIQVQSQLPEISDRLLIDGEGLIEIDGGGAPASASGLVITSSSSLIRGLIIYGFGAHGILLEDNGGNTIEGNVIGREGQENGGSGVFIDDTSTGNVIGGTADGAANTIAHNGGDGITVESGGDNALLGNTFAANGDQNIDLLDDGRSINLNNDGMQNFPVLIDSSFNEHSLIIEYAVEAETGPDKDLRVEFFKMDADGVVSFIGSDSYSTSEGDAEVDLGVVDLQQGDSLLATATDGNGEGSTSELSDTVASPDQVNLVVTKTASSASVTPGASVNFTIIVKNDGAFPATDVVLTDALPSAMSFASATDSGGGTCTETDGTVTCLLGGLIGGAETTVTISVNTTIEGTFINTASARADQLDTDEASDSSSATVNVAQPSAPPPPVGGGGVGGGGAAAPRPEPEIASSHQDIAFLFTAPLGGPNPPDQTLSIFNSGARRLAWFVSDSVGWLTLSPSIGTSEGEPDDVTLSIDVTDLPEGQYEAVITISAERASNTPQTVSVTLIVDRFGGDIEIALSQESLSFTGPQGGPSPVGKGFEVWNAGGGNLDWVLESNVDWLVPGPTSGSSSEGARTTVTVNVDPLGLVAGVHEGEITISGEGAVNEPQTIVVQFEVLPSAPEINIADTRFLFTAPEQGPNPATQFIQVINSGGGDLNFVIGSDQDWLIPTPETGVANESAGQVGLVINVSDLEQGTYEALVEIVSADAANSPQTVTVVLNVTEPTDTDGDGVPDVIELDAPNDGDANNDGIPDVGQQNVSSLPDLVEGLFVTLESPEGTQQSGVSAIENPSPGDAPARVNFPIGFYNSTIEGLSRGGATQQILTVNEPSRVSFNKFYKFGPTPKNPTPHWYDFTYDGETGVEFIAGAFVIHLVDGLRGDDDLTDNGRVVSVVAPAFDNRSDLVTMRSPVPVNVSTIQLLEYTVTILNEGPAPATDVLLLEEVPDEFEVVSARSDTGSCTTTAVLECRLSSLAEGASATFDIVLRPRQAVEAVALVSNVSSGKVDPNVDNNTVSDELSIIAPSFGEVTNRVAITAIEMNPTPAAHTLDISRTGIGPLSWRITPSCDPADADDPLPEWLSVSPSSGVTLDSALRVAVGVDISALTPGAYRAAFGIASDTALNGCQSVAVDLRLLSAIGRPKQSSVNLQTWELQGLSGIARDFFELKREEVSDPAQQEWFTAAGELAGGLESDETIRRSLVNPTTDEKTALTSLSRFSETLGNWGPHNDVPVAVGEFTVDMARKMAAILSGEIAWDSDALGIMEIGPTTGDLRLYAVYSKADQAVFLHFDIFDPVPGQIDGIVPVSVEEDDSGALRLVASIEDGEFFSRRSPTLRAAIRSPGELRVFDELGRITGIVSEEITTNIPNSTYFRDFVTILLASDSQADRFRYEITGFEEGLYGLDVIFTDTSGQVKTFPRTRVAIAAGEVHSYELDWDILDDERGWSWKIDVDGDGSYDREFPPPALEPQVIPRWVWPEAVIGVIVFVVVLAVIIWIAASWFDPVQRYASKISAPLGRVARRLGIRLNVPSVRSLRWSRWLRMPR